MTARVRRAVASAVAVASLVALAACGSGGSGTGATAGAGAALVMVGAQAGYAVLPSGARWIVIGTTDGWRTVTNATPTSVPTDGGLVLSATGTRVAVGVLPHEQLTVSPVLVSHDGAGTWAPTQLPGGLLAAPGALATSRDALWAIVTGGGGRLVTAASTAGPWREVGSATTVQPPGTVTFTGVGFPDGRTGFVTATGPADGLLLLSGSGGRPWQPVALPVTATGSATALTPCRVGADWLVPVVSDGRLVVYRSRALDGPWQVGSAVAVAAAPVVGCGRTAVWVVSEGGSSDRLLLSDGTGAWSDQGDLPAGVTSLSVADDDTAFATAGGAARLLRIQLGQPLATTWIPLPAWVATVGGGAMRN